MAASGPCGGKAAVSSHHAWGWEWGPPKPLGWGTHTHVLTKCLPCRGWLAWCPRLRTLLLDLLLIYISVPFLIRLFPVLLTKFVFLNFCECPGAVPTGRAPPRISAGGGLGGGGVPKTWVGLHPAPRVAPGQPLSKPPFAVGLQRRHGGTFPVGTLCFASCNNPVPPTLFTA